MNNRLFQLPSLGKSLREVGVRLMEVRLQLDGRAQMGDSAFELSLQQEHPAQRVVCFGALPTELDGCLKSRPRPCQVALLQGHVTALVDGLHVRSIRRRLASHWESHESQREQTGNQYY